MISFTFSNPVDMATVDAADFKLFDITSGLPGTEVSVSLSSPNPATVVLTPTGFFFSGTFRQVITAGATISDTSGQAFDTGGAEIPFDFTLTPSPQLEDFEAPSYGETSGLTQSERVANTAPTGGGRSGSTEVVRSTHRLRHTETDLVTPGRGLSVAHTRTYRNNQQAPSGIFGKNWHYSLDQRYRLQDVDSDGDNDFRFTSADGRVFTYENTNPTAPNFRDRYTPPPAYYETLEVVTFNGQLHLKRRSGWGKSSLYAFHTSTSAFLDPAGVLPSDAVGHLVAVRDENGNTIEIARHPHDDPLRPNEIDTITDPEGRVTNFAYSSAAGQENRVVSITQFEGASTRSWNYEYDPFFGLIKVKTPATDFADEGPPRTLLTNTQKVICYSYTTINTGVLVQRERDGRGLTGTESGRGERAGQAAA